MTDQELFDRVMAKIEHHIKGRQAAVDGRLPYAVIQAMAANLRHQWDNWEDWQIQYSNENAKSLPSYQAFIELLRALDGDKP
jgi:hypothetical protein